MSWWATAGIVAGGITAVLVLGGRLWSMARKIVHVFDVILGNQESNPPVLSLSERLERIEYELRPNEGRSLRDRVDLIWLNTRIPEEGE